jgi:hypothetical protein
LAPAFDFGFDCAAAFNREFSATLLAFNLHRRAESLTAAHLK